MAPALQAFRGPRKTVVYCMHALLAGAVLGHSEDVYGPELLSGGKG